MIQLKIRENRIAARGYIFTYEPNHPSANNSGYVPEHVFVAEEALGRCLPKGAEVHHFDENRKNNANANLVICQDRAYHMLLHQRQRAFKSCGNPNFRKCFLCATYEDSSKMRKSGKGFTHTSCYQEYMRNYYAKNKEKWGIAQPK
jgi:hypothetical protein